MEGRYIPAFITLFAGAVVSIISIVKSFEIIFSLKLLLAVLVVFYIVGLIAKKIIVMVITNEKWKKVETTEETEEVGEIGETIETEQIGEK